MGLCKKKLFDMNDENLHVKKSVEKIWKLCMGKKLFDKNDP